MPALATTGAARSSQPMQRAFLAAARAASLLQGRSRSASLALVGRALRFLWRSRSSRDWRQAEAASVAAWAALHRSPWPVCEALSFLEVGDARDEEDGALDPGLSWRTAASARFELALAHRLEARILSAVRDPVLRSLSFLSGAVLPSEAFLLHTIADAVGASLLLESGVGEGGSTRAACAWARSASSAEAPSAPRRVVALERRQLSERTLGPLAAACGDALEFRAGDAFETLEGVLMEAGAGRHEGNATVAVVFIDGPKGRVAVRLAKDILDRFPGVRAVALHDVPRLDPRYRDRQDRHLARKAMEALPYVQFFSDAAWYVAAFAERLDAHVPWSVRHGGTPTTGSYGHTLGVLVRDWERV